MAASDVPEQLVLRGTSDEDVLPILAQFQNRVELKSDLDEPVEKINKRAVRFLSLLLKGLSLRDLQSAGTWYP